MPNTNTAKKNLRKNIRRRSINKPVFSALRTFKKKAFETAETLCKQGGSSDDVIKAISSLIGKIHSKSRKNSFEKLKASRFESRLVARIKKKTSAS